jgi:hypothetical protein
LFIDDLAAESVAAFVALSPDGLEDGGRPLTLVKKRVLYTNLSRPSRRDLMNRSALSAVTRG